ncbi:phage head-tail joining protein [Magnetospirillum sp. SS-4]|uniref:phage head-tail joining protein n=1 Tax=Magnetospirillum sp. SS-4 TaxID=2681465 RepID=UPI0013865018|nr:hypothetical protein [Magnetospirillum sp. SS-4]CAA7619016.1 conserved hypothetical protein [Magnetospirillum sp. SS-4]
MADTDQLLAWREALLRARYAGTRIVEYDGRKVEYRSDSEMASALADLERRLGTNARVTQVRINSSKGV